ncbi:MAG TPA: ATP-binding protein [Myxococcales bacterium]|jgi:PAS domain S-box-containing protein
MDPRTATLEEFLVAVLRGATKILGCGSTSLIFINEKTQQIGIRLGSLTTSGPLVAQIEQVLGGRFGKLVYPLKSAQDSLVYRAWRERKTLETSSLAELVGSAFPKIVTGTIIRVIGEHRFIVVPAIAGSRNYGVLMFQKEGAHPFNQQQREVILRYARRIGEILENDLMGQGQQLIADLQGGPEYFVFGEGGELRGHVAGSSAPPELVADLSTLARAPAAERKATSSEVVDLRLDGRSAVLVRTQRPRETGSASLENQLLQLTLGEAVPSLLLDPGKRITSANPATEQALGYAPKALVGRPIRELFANPQEIDAILEQQALDPSNPSSEESAAVVLADRSVAAAHVEAMLLANDRDEAVGFLVLVRKDEAEDTPKNARDRLVQQERLASMGEMAAQLAHEMRNPLVAVGASLESLLRDPNLAEDHRSILSAVSREIVRMDMGLKDYLAARHDMSFVELDVAQVCEDARRLLEGAFRLSGKRITTAVPPGITVRADFDALKHVLFNLLLNALEASPPEGEVRCSAVAEQNAVTIAIEDRGAGLQASSEECFRPFFTSKKNGTGLGLSVCQKIARAHGGLVSIRNREGGGCRATLVLPQSRAGRTLSQPELPKVSA